MDENNIYKEDKFQVLVLCSTGEKEADMFYKNKFINYDIKDDLKNLGKYKNLLLIGDLPKIPESFNDNVSWIITGKIDEIKLNNGEYDKVDLFFNKNISENEDILVKRFGEQNIQSHEEVFFKKRLTSPCYLEDSVKNNIESEIYSKILSLINSKNNKDIIKFKKDRNIFSLMKRNILTDSLCEKIDEEILIIVTGNKEKIENSIYKNIAKDSDIIKRISSVIKHFYENYKTKSISSNVKIVNKLFLNYSKNGWKKTIPFFEKLQLDYPITIDTFIEKSFSDMNFFYNSEWTGVIHDTKEYDLKSLLNNRNFIKSLDHCKNIVVFTEYTKKKIVDSINFNKINVLSHPVDFDRDSFSMEYFTKNPKKVIQLGEWLNFFGIYRLETYISKFTDRNYDIQFDNKNTVIEEYLDERIKSVKVIDINDEKLENNIVFLNIYDVSEVNIINECIVRNIPVLVNKLDCVVELLGEDYPFYYETFCGATMKIDNIKIIEKTHNYLMRMDKEKYKPDVFVNSFSKLLR